MNESLISLKNRSVIKITGPDRFDFLQGLITQDIFLLNNQDALYTALLNVQGRYLHDFFIYGQPDHFLIETDHRGSELLQRFKLYRLRRQVEFDVVPMHVYIGFSLMEACLCFDDPRSPGLWQRILSHSPLHCVTEDLSHYDYLRMKYCLPESGMDLVLERTFPLEAGLDSLNAISFKKGCYIGQEPVARAFYQGVIRKKLMTVRIEGDLPPYGSKITTAEGVDIGDLRSTVVYKNEKFGIAMLRLEAVEEGAFLYCGDALLHVATPQAVPV